MPGSGAPTGPAEEGAWFRDVAAETGLDFVHFAGISGEYYYNEMMGSGAALLDVDGDGDLDVYLVQGSMQGGEAPSKALLPPPKGQALTDRLYRSDLEVDSDGERQLTFTDVTEASGLEAAGYGMGVATGDVDNDGDVDLYVTNFGANQLWLNDSTGSFTEGAEAAGVADPRWGVSATFLDYDGDGWLDLWVANYLDYRLANHKRCTTELGGPNYCGPLSYAPQADALYRNRGDGTFEDVSGRVGLKGAPAGGALGVIAADLDRNGYLDIYVANDGLPNHLWKQGPGGSFEEGALLAGLAVNAAGQPEASMGVDAADVDGDGDEDLFLTHLTRETNTLYLNDGRGLFSDATASSGLGPPSWDRTAFGTAFFDPDNDGDLDLLTVAGAVKVVEELALAGDPLPLHQPNQLFVQRGDGTFEEAGVRSGKVFELSEVSRGAAFGDVDNDGDVDVLVSNNSGPVRLLENALYPGIAGSDPAETPAWLGLEVQEPLGGDARRHALGAEVVLETEEPGEGGDSGSQLRRIASGGSYASAGDPRRVFGLGPSPAPSYTATVRWAGDSVSGAAAPLPRFERFRRLAPGRYHQLVRGTGEALSAGDGAPHPWLSPQPSNR